MRISPDFQKFDEIIWAYMENLVNLYRFGKFDFSIITNLLENSNDLFANSTFDLKSKTIEFGSDNSASKHYYDGYYRLLMEYYPIYKHFQEYILYETNKTSRKYKTVFGRFSYYELRTLIYSEQDREKRCGMLASLFEIYSKMPPLHQKFYISMQNKAHDLGFKSIQDWATNFGICDFPKLFTKTCDFLTKNTNEFQKIIANFVDLKLKLSLSECSIGDIWYIYNLRALYQKIEQSFRNSFSTIKIFDFFNQYGFGKCFENENFIIDIEQRQNKNPRAFTAHILSREENLFKTYLVSKPLGVFGDQKDIMHETGHAIHFLNIHPRLAPIFHIAFDPAITEVIAILFENLYSNISFLNSIYDLGSSLSKEIQDYFQFMNLYMIFNYALNFKSEYCLMQQNDPLTDEHFAKAQENYESDHYKIFGFHRNGSDHLSRELDRFFGNINYLRGYSNARNLEESLQHEDPKWFENVKIAEKIKNQYMIYGFSINFDELLAKWGINSYEFPKKI